MPNDSKNSGAKTVTDAEGNELGVPDAAALAAAKQPEPAPRELTKGAAVVMFVDGPGPSLQRMRGVVKKVHKTEKAGEPERADIEIAPEGKKPVEWPRVAHVREGDAPRPHFRLA